MKKVQKETTPNTILWAFINDIRKFLQLQEDKDKYKMSQHFVRIKYLFCRYVIKSWFGTNFSTNKYTEYNRIIIKYCMNFYINCWYHRNEIAQNKEIQKQRIHEWYKSE